MFAHSLGQTATSPSPDLELRVQPVHRCLRKDGLPSALFDTTAAAIGSVKTVRPCRQALPIVRFVGNTSLIERPRTPPSTTLSPSLRRATSERAAHDPIADVAKSGVRVRGHEPENSARASRI